MTRKDSTIQFLRYRVEAMEIEILKLNLLLIGYKLVNDYYTKNGKNKTIRKS